jgi:hypothetical protein
MSTRSPDLRAVIARFAAAGALALALLAPAAASAGKSHLLQKPESHVVLTSTSATGVDQCGSGWVDRVFAEVGPDGTVAAQEYVVPQGHVLVVTDVDWRTHEGSNSFVSGQLHLFSITLGPFPNPEVFEVATPVDATLAAAGVAAGSASLTTGFRVHPGVPICPLAASITSGSGASNLVASVILRGYLLKSK